MGDIGHINYTGQFGNIGDIFHMGGIRYFGLQNVLVCHSRDTVLLHGDILLVQPPAKESCYCQLQRSFSS